ncbi:MAG TPA: hypothetical protein VN934_07500 [Candidatus Tumulicola sp.]|jgi:hypothetical protein|nr:hypothetical protein [Candidatus Tumulicola sp.]
MPRPELSRVADLAAALGEHVVDLERRIQALESGTKTPKAIAASDLRRITKALMRLSLELRKNS